jgi:hypothetical protein
VVSLKSATDLGTPQDGLMSEIMRVVYLVGYIHGSQGVDLLLCQPFRQALDT